MYVYLVQFIIIHVLFCYVMFKTHREVSHKNLYQGPWPNENVPCCSIYWIIKLHWMQNPFSWCLSWLPYLLIVMAHWTPWGQYLVDNIFQDLSTQKIKPCFLPKHLPLCYNKLIISIITWSWWRGRRLICHIDLDLVHVGHLINSWLINQVIY
jgi:hypothetical protein